MGDLVWVEQLHPLELWLYIRGELDVYRGIRESTSEIYILESIYTLELRAAVGCPAA